jgi:formiminotetrahydrofolate cyclodeaminase
LANVEINLDGIKDAGYVTAVREKVAALRERLGETSRVNA